MAEKEDKGLIGFDPLAWMNDEAETEKSDDTVAEDSAEVDDVPMPVKEVVVQSEHEELDVVDSDAEVLVDDESKIQLAATVNIQHVGKLHERLLKLIESQDKIEIDASAVEVIDTASLQLFIVLKQAATQLHKEMVIDFPSDSFIEAAELLGLSEMLEVDHAAAGLF